MAKTTTRQLAAVATLMSDGASSSGAIAIIANFSWECGSPSLPTAFRNPKNSHLDHGSQGLAQWRLSRLDNYMKFVAEKHPELDHTDFSPDGDLWPWFGRLDYQLEFTLHEMQTSYPKLWAKIKEGGDVVALTADVCWQYEVPAKAYAHLADRVAYAKAISAAMVTQTKIRTDATTHLAARAKQHDDAQAGSAAFMAIPAVALAGGGLAPIAHLIPWWGWLMIVIFGIMFVAGVVAFVQAHLASAAVAQASASATPNAPNAAAASKPAPKMPQVGDTPDAPHLAETKEMHRKANAAAAAQGEKQTLAKALVPSEAAADAAHAAVAKELEAPPAHKPLA